MYSIPEQRYNCSGFGVNTIFCKSDNGGNDMASGVRNKVILACTECKQRNYNTMKNKRNNPDRIELMKYCKFCNKETLHKETK